MSGGQQKKEKFNSGDFVSIVSSVCAYSLTTPMDHHLHGIRAMTGSATISVPPMSNTTHETAKERGK